MEKTSFPAMTKEEFIKKGTALPDAVADCPFDADFDSVILRHRKSRKWFALVTLLEGRPIANLKCEPMKAEFWRSAYKDVIPAWHMNKTHWNTVFLDGLLPQEVLLEMLEDSYRLTSKT